MSRNDDHHHFCRVIIRYGQIDLMVVVTASKEEEK